MKCPSNDDRSAEIFMDLVAGKLSVETKALRDHAKECRDCSVLLADQAFVWSALDEFAAPDISAGFDRTVLSQVEPLRPQPWWARLWKPAIPFAVTCASAAVFFLMRAPEVQTPTFNPSQIESAQMSSSVDVEQVEQALDDLEMLEQLTPAADSAAGEMKEM